MTLHSPFFFLKQYLTFFFHYFFNSPFNMQTAIKKKTKIKHHRNNAAG